MTSGDCAAILPGDGEDMDMAACADNTECAGYLTCAMAIQNPDEPCQAELGACLASEVCLAIVEVPEGDDANMSACMDNAECSALVACQTTGPPDTSEPTPAPAPTD
eukprot:COSAG06_NODE_24215_length_669_cov_1.033333_2_plen_106_part_01